MYLWSMGLYQEATLSPGDGLNLNHHELVAFQGKFVRITMASFQATYTNPQDFSVRFVVTRRPGFGRMGLRLGLKTGLKI